jgi:hypothetical protein
MDPSTDLGLMMAFMRDLVNGDGDRDLWCRRLGDLKDRGLIRQTQSGRSLATETGKPLWEHAKRAVAREALGLSAPQARRPCFVVFDSEERPVAFQEWDQAVAFARWQMESHPEPFSHVRMPEDAVELWDRSSLSQGEADLLEETGQAPVCAPTKEDAAA